MLLEQFWKKILFQKKVSENCKTCQKFQRILSVISAFYLYSIYKNNVKLQSSWKHCKKQNHSRIRNNLADHQRHIFHPVTLLMKLCRRMQAFPRNDTFFSRVHFNLISAKKLSNQSVAKKTHFYEIISFDTHATANFPLSPILKYIKFSLKKPSFYFQKKRTFVLFEKSYHFSRILQRSCYYLVKQNFHG